MTERAVQTIQNAWQTKFRFFTTRRVIQEFAAHGLCVSFVKGASFKSLLLFLRDKATVSITKTCLRRVHQLSLFRHGSPPKHASSPTMVNTRVFLAAYTIVFHPARVFPVVGPREDALRRAAAPLLEAFHGLLDAIGAKGSFQAIPPELSRDFTALMDAYLERFDEWRSIDRADQAHRIKHALLSVSVALDYLPPGDSRLKADMCAQIARLRTQLEGLAGVDALRVFDEGRRVHWSHRKDRAVEARRMRNEQLAHELLLDPMFRVGEDGEDEEVDLLVARRHSEDFWAALANELQQTPPQRMCLRRALEEIKQSFLVLDVREAADLVVEAEPAQLIDSMVGLVRRHQSQKREHETQTRWEAISTPQYTLTNALHFLFDRLRVMSIDAANAQLAVLAPIVEAHGVGYERERFHDKLADGVFTLGRTAHWIRFVVEKEVGAGRVELSAVRQGGALAQVHTAMMLAVVADGRADAVRRETCPETLFMDVPRLAVLQREYRYLVTAMTQLVTLTHALVAAPNNLGVLGRVAAVFVQADPAVGTEALLAPIRALLLESTLTASAQRTVVRAVCQCTLPTDSVHVLMATRVRTLCEQIMAAGRLQHAFPRAMRPLVPRLEKHAQVAVKLLAVATLNRTVHLATYKGLLSDAAQALVKEV